MTDVHQERIFERIVGADSGADRWRRGRVCGANHSSGALAAAHRGAACRRGGRDSTGNAFLKWMAEQIGETLSAD